MGNPPVGLGGGGGAFRLDSRFLVPSFAPQGASTISFARASPTVPVALRLQTVVPQKGKVTGTVTGKDLGKGQPSFSSASGKLSPRDIAHQAKEKPQPGVLTQEPLSERINAKVPRKVRQFRDARGLTRAESQYLDAHSFNVDSLVNAYQAARQDYERAQQARVPYDWGNKTVFDNIEHVFQTLQEYAFPTTDDFGRPIKRLTYPTFESPEGAKLTNVVRNVVQGGISGGLQRSAEGEGSESVIANVGTTLSNLVDPRYTLENLSNAGRAAVLDAGPQMVDPYMPDALRTDTASGRLFHSALGMATAPEVMRSAPNVIGKRMGPPVVTGLGTVAPNLVPALQEAGGKIRANIGPGPAETRLRGGTFVGGVFGGGQGLYEKYLEPYHAASDNTGGGKRSVPVPLATPVPPAPNSGGASSGQPSAQPSRVTETAVSPQPSVSRWKTGSYTALKQAGLSDKHHIIQDAALKGLPGYNYYQAPNIQLPGPASNTATPHGATRIVQKQAGGGTYAAERRISYKALRKATLTPEEARAVLKDADAFFRKIGIIPGTRTQIPKDRPNYVKPKKS